MYKKEKNEISVQNRVNRISVKKEYVLDCKKISCTK